MSSVNLISVLAIPSARLLIKLLNITGAITGSLRILLSPFLKFHSKPLITVLFVQLYNQVFAHLRGILWGKYCRLYQKNCKNRAIWCLLLLTCNCYIFFLENSQSVNSSWWRKIGGCSFTWSFLERLKIMFILGFAVIGTIQWTKIFLY